MKDDIVLPITPVLGYAVLKRTNALPGFIAPQVEVVALWHDGNRPPPMSSPKNATKTTLNQLRVLHGNERVSFAIGLVAMPDESAWSA